jgi:hypothetical protein
VGAFAILFGKAEKHPVKGRGRFNIGITQGKIKDLVGAVFFFQAIPLLKHFTDHGLGTQDIFDLPCNRHG